MDLEDEKRDDVTAAEKHRRFHNRIGTMFLVLAAIVAAWMFVAPDGGNPIVLLLVQLPLFVILALIGMKSLLKAATGMPGRRRR